jgi:serine/threonine protein kinase
MKPENILIDKNGYLKLVDFDNSNFCESKFYTICGTPNYMAPEMLLGYGYNENVD